MVALYSFCKVHCAIKVILNGGKDLNERCE